MPFILVYILKLSVSLAVVFFFYQFALRKLTFYNWNRWYLLGYSLLSFFIPFIDVSAVLKKNEWTEIDIVQWVPVIHQPITGTAVIDGTYSFTAWNFISLLLITGMLIMLIRLLIQFISFRRLKRKARFISGEGVNLYQVDENIIPFSFGNSIFINRHLHTEEELQEIIRHEFVHVKQRHSLDIISGEILCLLNWYNPFAWMLRRAIRQNLEFIADDKVLQNGISRKEYQYLLLKVIGNNHFSIAPKFNFSSLKKRIAMMNKMKSAGVHIVKFLFILPLAAVMLLAFRSKWEKRNPGNNDDKKVSIAGLVVDSKTMKPLANATIFCPEKNIRIQTDVNGYYLLRLPYENKPLQFSLQISKEGYSSFIQNENWGNFYEDYIRDLYSHTYEFFGLGKKNDGFSGIAGNSKTMDGLSYTNVARKFQGFSKDIEFNSDNINDTIPFVVTPNSKGYFIDIIGNKDDCLVVVKDKNGKHVEKILLTRWNAEVKTFEAKYGEILLPPPPPVPAVEAVPAVEPVPPLEPAAAVAPVSPVPPSIITCPPVKTGDAIAPVAIVSGKNGIDLSRISSEYEITDKKAVIKLKDGAVEKYNLTNKEERAAFEKKYGKIIRINTSVNTNIRASINTNANVNANVTSNINTNVNTAVKTIIAPSSKSPALITTASPKGAVNINSSVIAPAAVRSTNRSINRSTRSTDRAINRGTVTAGAVATSQGSAVVVIDDYGHVITGKEDIIITITKRTTRQELDNCIKQMKEKGVELDFDDVEYNDKGILVSINGSMKSGGSNSNFVATDFDTLVLAMIKKGEKTYFKVSAKDDKELI